jgi:hypothetical protein
MLPEKDVIARNMGAWISLVLDALEEDDTAGPGYDHDAPLLGQTFSYDETKQSAPYRITTTREDWLAEMPERDRMSRQGRDPDDVQVGTGYLPPTNPYNPGTVTGWTGADPKAPGFDPTQHGGIVGQPLDPDLVAKLEEDLRGVYEGMGAYGAKTDAVRYLHQRKDTQAVLVEVRNPPTANGPNEWFGKAKALYDAMVKAIANPYGADAVMPFVSAETPGQKKMREQQELEATLQALIADVQKKGKRRKPGGTGQFSLPK